MGGGFLVGVVAGIVDGTAEGGVEGVKGAVGPGSMMSTKSASQSDLWILMMDATFCI